MTDRIADGGRTDVPQAERHVLGEPGVPVTVVEYGDYECPYCAGAAPILRELVSTSQGRVRLVFRNFPLFEVHAHALTAALAAESTAASGGESAFWAMHAKLFAHQARLSGPDLRLYAEAVGADPDLAVGDAAQQFAPIVQADYASGIEAGVSATPTLFVDGVPYDGRLELGALQRATGLSGNVAAQVRRRPWQRRKG
jgi:protein-disulfide isomerase